MRRPSGSRKGATWSLALLLAAGALAVAPGAVEASGPSAAPEQAVDLPRALRGTNAVRLLGDRVDEAAALNGMTEAELVELLTTDSTAWVSTQGRVFYKEGTAAAPAGAAAAPWAAVAPLEQTFELHSNPGSSRKIFLDFDGGTARGTHWHNQFPSTPIAQPAWDPSGNGASFDDAERTKIQEIWEIVAEDYAPFDVDVTTQDPGPAGIHRSGVADSSYGSHVLITPSTGAANAICGGGCGGVAFIDVFDVVDGGGSGAAGDGYGYLQPAWVFPQALGNWPKNIAEAASHEVGHNLGLDHDGNASADYDTGHGAWAPIMGAGYHHPISQWSQGDYAGANQHEDDVAIIASVVGRRADEAPSSLIGAQLPPTGTAYITSRSDVDTYVLGSCSGTVTVDAEPLFAAANLDIKISLLDATGQVVATADPASAQVSSSVATGLDASLSKQVSSGIHYVAVEGVGNGSWAASGYDDYGSLGAYTLTSTGCDGVAPLGTPAAPTHVQATAHATAPSITVMWDTPVNDGGSAITGYVLTRSGSAASVEVGPSARSYSWTGLAAATSYSFTVTARNAQGTGPTVSAGASTAAAPMTPTTPPPTNPTTTPTTPVPTATPTPPGSTGSSPPAPATLRVTAPRTARPGSRPKVVVRALRGSAPATGTVVVTVGKKTWTLALKAGKAALRLPKVKAGRVRVAVRYSGDATTLPAKATSTIKVKR